MKDTPRRAVLLLALLAAGAAAYFAPAAQQSVSVVKPKPNPEVAPSVVPLRQASAPRGAIDMQVLGIRPREEERSRGRPDDLFASPAPAALPPPVGPSPAPVPSVPPPEPPPVAFKILGTYAEEGRPGLFVEYKEENLLAKVGDTVGGLYRIEAIQDSKVTIRYLPLDRQQFIDLSEPSAK